MLINQYAACHDGFAFFRSVTANPAFCAGHIVSFRPLPGGLARAGAALAFSFLVPDLCHDGHDAPCVSGAPGGVAQADAFLAQWVSTATPGGRSPPRSARSSGADRLPRQGRQVSWPAQVLRSADDSLSPAGIRC